jgi:hypothetical protein
MSDPRDKVAAAFKEAAVELERAAAHCRIAALHYEDREVPRGCAHAFAAIGHIRQAENSIDENAILHSGKARTELDPGAEA